MKHNSFLNFIFVASAKIFSLGTLFVGNILVARLTGPEEFGFYSVSLALIVLYDALVGAPLDNAVIRFSSFHKEHPERTNQIQGDIFWFKVIISLFFLGLSLCFLEELSLIVFNNSNQQKVLILTLLCGTALVMIRSSSCYMQIHALFKDYANIDTLQGVFRISFVLLFFWLSMNDITSTYLINYGITTLTVFISIYGFSTLMVFIIYQFKVRQDFLFSALSSVTDRKTMLSYIGATSTIVILGTLSGRADIPLISALGSAHEAGLYSVAAQIAMIGLLLASYMAIVFQAKLIEFAKEGLLEGLIIKNIVIVLLLSLVAIPVTIWIIPWVIPFLFGEQYSMSVIVLQILVIGVCLDLLILPILMPYAIQAFPKTVIKGEVVITLLFFSIAFFGIEINAVTMAWLVTCVRVLKFLLYFFSVTLFLRKARLRQQAT